MWGYVLDGEYEVGVSLLVRWSSLGWMGRKEEGVEGAAWEGGCEVGDCADGLQ